MIFPRHAESRGTPNAIGGHRRPRSGAGRRLYLLAAALILAATAATACSGDDERVSSDPADLTGKTFVSTKVSGSPIPGDGQLEVAFTDGSISAHAGCNRFSGEVSFDGDSLSTGELASTMMACAPPLDTVDAWVSELFAEPLRWQLTGTELTLSRGDRTVTLAERTDHPVVGTTWEVTGIVKHEAVASSAVLKKAKPRFRIDDQGKVTGNAGCNAINGTATVSEPTIEFGPLATTRMACPPDVAEVEKSVLAALRGGVSVDIDGDAMSLTNTADGNIGLRLTAVDD